VTLQLDVEAELRRVLHRQAADVVFADEPFNPMPRLPVAASAVQRRRYLGVIAVAACLVLVVVGTAVVRSRESRPVDAGAPGRAAVALALVNAIAPDEWVVPAPTGEYELDLAFNPGDQRNARFVATNDPTRSLSIIVAAQASIPSATPLTDVEIAGVQWKQAADAHTTLVRQIGDDWVTVWETGVSQNDLLQMVAGMIVIPESSLSRTVLSPVKNDANWIDVATVTGITGDHTLTAISDGRTYCLFFRFGSPGTPATPDSGGGCGERMQPDQVVVYGPSVGPAPDSAAPMDSLFAGLLSDQVATIEVHLHDGSVVNAVAQDLSNAYPVNFYLVALPTDAAGDSPIVSITAFDAEGQLLQDVTPG
jgi:hypothetical protein